MRAVLMLHGVDASDSVLSMTTEQLCGLIAAIRGSGHEIVPLSRWLSDPAGDRQIALTFDDGFASVAQAAAPVLADAGVPATLFLTTGFVGRDNRWPSQPKGSPVFEMLDWDQIEALHRGGWEIEAHSVSHPDLRSCSTEQLAEELDEPVVEIEQRLGRRPRIFSYPYGHFDPRVAEAVQLRFEWAVTTRMATLQIPATAPHHIPRIDTYYMRQPAVFRSFGRRRFSLYLGARSLLRRARNHAAQLA